MNELVQIVFMASAEIDERLDGLIGVSAEILSLCGFDGSDGVGYEDGEVGDAAVDIGGFVDADERLVENLEKVAEEFESRRLRSLSAFTATPS